MNKFEIATDDLKYIFASLLPAVSKLDAKPIYTCVKFNGDTDKVSAYALDGYRMHSVTVPIKITDGDPIFSFMIRPFAIPKTQSDIVACELSEKEIMFDFGERKFIERIQFGDFIDVNTVVPTSAAAMKIGFNAVYLMDAAKTLKSKQSYRDPIVMEIRNPLTPVVIYRRSDKNDFRLILPVRLGTEDD